MDQSEVIYLIEQAFIGVRLGDGIGIFEADALDGCVSDNKRQVARTRDERKHWQHIPDSVLEEYYSALCFMDEQGLLFHLPAYMRFAVNHHASSSSISVNAAILALSRTSPGSDPKQLPLSEKQKTAIAKFLKFMVLTAEEGNADTWQASLAYEQTWGFFDQ